MQETHTRFWTEKRNHIAACRDPKNGLSASGVQIEFRSWKPAMPERTSAGTPCSDVRETLVRISRLVWHLS